MKCKLVGSHTDVQQKWKETVTVTRMILTTHCKNLYGSQSAQNRRDRLPYFSRFNAKTSSHRTDYTFKFCNIHRKAVTSIPSIPKVFFLCFMSLEQLTAF